MNHTSSLFRFILLLTILTMGLSGAVLAADGFDTNYVGGDANQLSVTINSLNRAVLFGPGLMSTGDFFINIPNGATDDRGQVSSFTITGATSYLRSAYLDRVVSTTLYYRIYPAMSAPPVWSTLSLQSQSVLGAATCYTETQSNTWQVNQSLNVLQGLANGNYVLEFYIQSELYDAGLEDGGCVVNAIEQCNTTQIHTGRYISTRFNTTDPTACDLNNTMLHQSDPTRIIFEVINSPLPVELAYFRGTAEDKQVLLQWGTAQEQDLESFLVERSSDGYQWLPLAELPAAGNSATLRHYTLPDRQPMKGPNYYRLKARGSDGSLDISPVIVVTVSETDTGLSVWPNPVRETLYFTLTEKTDAPRTLRVFNANGQVVAEQTDEGSDISSMNINDLADGFYFLEMSDQRGFRTRLVRFVKMR